ncbi:MAG: phenylacetate--CoA ligase family protein, partial [bacterium]
MNSFYTSRQAGEADQLKKLNELLLALKVSNAFYNEKIALSGIRLPLTYLKDFKKIFPFTTKAELEIDQRKHPPFGTNLTFPFENYTRFSQTSGSTGKPMRWLDTNESWSWMVENWKRVFEAAKVQAGETVFFAFSFGPFLGFWVAFDAAQRIGCLCIPAGGMNSVARLHAIIANKANILCCTPTYALHLAAVAQKENIDLSNSQVRAIIA